MKAIRQRSYGPPDVLQLVEINAPEVDDDGVLVRVRAASINVADWHFMRGLPFPVRMAEGLRRPRSSSVGYDVAGEVVAVGKNVRRLRVDLDDQLRGQQEHARCSCPRAADNRSWQHVDTQYRSTRGSAVRFAFWQQVPA